MGKHEAVARPIWRPAELRKAVTEWAAQGFSVTIDPDGSIHVSPSATKETGDPFDLVDMKR
jgi:hypothetical protein